nr:hypothetical protein [Moorella thermoacetica]
MSWCTDLIMSVALEKRKRYKEFFGKYVGLPFFLGVAFRSELFKPVELVL